MIEQVENRLYRASVALDGSDLTVADLMAVEADYRPSLSRSGVLKVFGSPGKDEVHVATEGAMSIFVSDQDGTVRVDPQMLVLFDPNGQVLQVASADRAKAPASIRRALQADEYTQVRLANAVTWLFPTARLKRIELDLGGGDDVFIASASNRRETIIPTIVNGARGNDTIATIGYPLARGYGSSGDDTLTASQSFNFGDVYLDGGDGNDTLGLESARGLLAGGAGNDTLSSYNSFGTLAGGDGDDQLTLRARQPGDVVYRIQFDGGAGADVVDQSAFPSYVIDNDEIRGVESVLDGN